MKLAGLTWWRNNYGSILQAYALQEELNSIPGISYEIINQYGKKIASFDNLIDKNNRDKKNYTTNFLEVWNEKIA